MRLDVVFSPTELPAALGALPGAACAIIDVVRATTSLTVMGERAVLAVHIAADIPHARTLAARYPNALLVGEEGGAAPAGFDYSNTPSGLSAAPIAGREVIFATTNGTRAFVTAEANGASIMLAAALRNAGAVADFALRQPASSAFLLVCAGRSQRVALDDLYTAGMLAGIIQAQASAQQIPLHMNECAELALHVARTAGTPLDVLQRSASGQSTAEVGMAVDLPWCAALSVSTTIPRVIGKGANGEPIIAFASH